MKELNKKELSTFRESVYDIEDGQKFIEREFEEQKEKIKELIKFNKKMFSEKKDYIMESKTYTRVGKKTNIEINRLTQYNKSSFMLELSGIPR